MWMFVCSCVHVCVCVLLLYVHTDASIHVCMQANAVLLTVSLLLLVKAQCGMTSKVKWDEKRRKNMNTSK